MNLWGVFPWGGPHPFSSDRSDCPNWLLPTGFVFSTTVRAARYLWAVGRGTVLDDSKLRDQAGRAAPVNEEGAPTGTARDREG